MAIMSRVISLRANQRPRRSLLAAGRSDALGALFDRAALGVEICVAASGRRGDPRPGALDLEEDLIAALREVRSVRTRSGRRVPCNRTRR